MVMRRHHNEKFVELTLDAVIVFDNIMVAK